jgi:hypothetical protein
MNRSGSRRCPAGSIVRDLIASDLIGSDPTVGCLIAGSPIRASGMRGRLAGRRERPVRF